jgi:hypothetical protein
MADLVQTAQNVNSHVSPPRELISGEPFQMFSLFISISNSHPTRRVVHSINTPPYVLLKKYGFPAAELLSGLHTLVLPCSSWTCEEIPLGYPTSCSTDSSFAAPYCVD